MGFFTVRLQGNISSHPGTLCRQFNSELNRKYDVCAPRPNARRRRFCGAWKSVLEFFVFTLIIDPDLDDRRQNNAPSPTVGGFRGGFSSPFRKRRTRRKINYCTFPRTSSTFCEHFVWHGPTDIHVILAVVFVRETADH